MQVCQDCESEMWKYCDLPSCPWHEKRPQHVDNHGSFMLFDCSLFISCIGFGFSPPIPTRMTWCQFAGHVSIFLPSTYIYPNPTKMIYGVNSQDSSYDIPLFLHKDYIMYIHSPPLSISLFNDTMSSQFTGHLLPQKQSESANLGDTLDGEVKKKSDLQKVWDLLMQCRWQLSFWSLLSFL